MTEISHLLRSADTGHLLRGASGHLLRRGTGDEPSAGDGTWSISAWAGFLKASGELDSYLDESLHGGAYIGTPSPWATPPDGYRIDDVYTYIGVDSDTARTTWTAEILCFGTLVHIAYGTSSSLLYHLKYSGTAPDLAYIETSYSFGSVRPAVSDETLESDATLTLNIS